MLFQDSIIWVKVVDALLIIGGRRIDHKCIFGTCDTRIVGSDTAGAALTEVIQA